MGAGGTAAGYVISHLVEPYVGPPVFVSTVRCSPRSEGGRGQGALIPAMGRIAVGTRARLGENHRKPSSSIYRCTQAGETPAHPGARAPTMGHTTACRRETSAYPVQAPALPRWVIPLPAGARRLRTQSRRPHSRDGSHCCRHTGETGREPPKAVVIDIPLHAGGRDARAPRPCSDAHRIWCQAVSAVNTR